MSVIPSSLFTHFYIPMSIEREDSPAPFSPPSTSHTSQISSFSTMIWCMQNEKSKWKFTIENCEEKSSSIVLQVKNDVFTFLLLAHHCASSYEKRGGSQFDWMIRFMLIYHLLNGRKSGEPDKRRKHKKHENRSSFPLALLVPCRIYQILFPLSLFHCYLSVVSPRYQYNL